MKTLKSRLALLLCLLSPTLGFGQSFSVQAEFQPAYVVGNLFGPVIQAPFVNISLQTLYRVPMEGVKPVVGVTLDAYNTYVLNAGAAWPQEDGPEEFVALVGAGAPFPPHAYRNQYPSVYQVSIAWHRPLQGWGITWDGSIGVRETFMGSFDARSSFLSLLTIPLAVGLRF